MHTGFVQVPLQPHRHLHLYVVLEEAAAERGLVVGLPRRGRGLDGRLQYVPGYSPGFLTCIVPVIFFLL